MAEGRFDSSCAAEQMKGVNLEPEAIQARRLPRCNCKILFLAVALPCMHRMRGQSVLVGVEPAPAFCNHRWRGCPGLPCLARPGLASMRAAGGRASEFLMCLSATAL